MFFAKKHFKILAVCDKNLIGKKFKQGETVLNLNEHSSFYGEEVEEKVIKQWLEEAFTQKHSLNIVGKKSVDLASNVLNLKSKPLLIEDIPVLQVYFV
ncbi:MAG: DUF424 domain-containing protein [Candidatus Marsarchaeota archaeon]|nr:DUF424 domain-containing protein [Candidatus Marsarchaeota archaeon]